MSAPSAVADLLGRGRQRQVRYLLVQGISAALAVALAGFFLLLILGTQILNWYWLAILFAVGLAAGAWRARNTLHSRYEIAQEIDARLGLHDAISTAYFFDLHPGRTASPPDVIEHQRAAAERLAVTADLGRGLPFVIPRTAYVNAALSLAVFAMFGLRYGITRSIDLRAALVHVSFDGFFTPSRQIAKAERRPGGALPLGDDGRDAQGLPSEPGDAPSNPDQMSDSNRDALSSPDDKSGSKADSKKNSSGDSPDDSQGQDPMNSAGKNNGQKGAPDSSDKEGNTPGENAKDSKSGSQPGSNNGENTSLADRMKDALSSLLSKLKPQSNSSPGSSPQQNNNNQSAQQKNQQGKDSKGKGDSGDQQSDSNDGGDSEAGEQSASAPQQGSANQSASNNPSPDGANGIGRQDGDKSAREAAQQAAMGKISEIIGKRAANINGDVMVEVAPGKQQLKTQYSESSATHTDSGGEVNRDEIPLAYQHYVEQYFEQVRKAPADKGKLDPKAKGSGN